MRQTWKWSKWIFRDATSSSVPWKPIKKYFPIIQIPLPELILSQAQVLLSGQSRWGVLFAYGGGKQCQGTGNQQRIPYIRDRQWRITLWWNIPPLPFLESSCFLIVKGWVRPLSDVDQGKGRLLALHSFIQVGRWSLWGFLGIVIMDFRPTTLFITHRDSWRSLRIHSISIPQVAFLPLSGHPISHSIVFRRQE